MPKISSGTIAEHKAHVWNELLDAMDALILERPFESISMRDVSERSGVARTAVYNYAPDTLTLLVATATRGSADVYDAVSSRGATDSSLAPSQRLREIVTVLLVDFAQSTRAFLAMQSIERTIGQERLTDAVIPARDLIGDTIVDVVQAGVEVGEFAPLTDPGLTRALMVGVMQVALRHGDPGQPIGMARADAVAQFIINALSNPLPNGDADHVTR
ncbi:TetR/AcrR family transcriptional regulator [Marisediminicola sp. LYQ134]|uniref:TetR/AcrR family transcriptional regulator n=1 Tax=Marisediminicola sp. LYQ134 TaxID=3391061 RepID=UPI003982D9F5